MTPYHHNIFLSACFLSLVVARPQQTDLVQNSSSSIPSGDLAGYKQTIFLPWINKFSSSSTPSVRAKIGRQSFDFPIDTGGTGVLIGAPHLPNVDASSGTPGWDFFSSSGILHNGHYMNLTISFIGDKQTNDWATSKVPVLVVNESWECPWYDPTVNDGVCPQVQGKQPKKFDISKVTYMGVGFGLSEYPMSNPFIDVDAINGKRISDETYRHGYAVSTRGVYLGLTAENTKEAAWVNLDAGKTGKPHDWQMVKMAFTSNNGSQVRGHALIDTGISQAYIQSDATSTLPIVSVKYADPPVSVDRVKDGTKLSLAFPNFEEGVAGYDFIVGDKEFPGQPNYVEPVTKGSEPSFNTGRNFLRGFTVAYDAVGGKLGFVCVMCHGEKGEEDDAEDDGHEEEGGEEEHEEEHEKEGNEEEHGKEGDKEGYEKPEKIPHEEPYGTPSKKPVYTPTGGKPIYTSTGGKPLYMPTGGKPIYTPTGGKPIYTPTGIPIYTPTGIPIYKPTETPIYAPPKEQPKKDGNWWDDYKGDYEDGSDDPKAELYSGPYEAPDEGSGGGSSWWDDYKGNYDI